MAASAAPNVSQRVLPRYAPPAPTRKRSSRSSSRRTIIILACVFGGLALFAVFGIIIVAAFLRIIAGPQAEPYANLLEGRRGFSTKLGRQESVGEPVPQPPPALFLLEQYPSPAGPLAAYVSPPPGDGSKRPAMIWIFGGFDNSIGETAWEPSTPDNDQSASAFREAGMVMMYPSLRGGNSNPGCIEAFYGEVDDVLAAAEYLAKKDYVDPNRIYLGGHSTGGTLAMLVAAATDRFRAVFAFGPVDDVGGYGSDVLPFDTWNSREIALRSPIKWLHAMNCPTFVFEGSGGNISCLRAMRRASQNPRLQFLEARQADHFSILAPVTRLVAQKIQQDTGPTCSLQFTAEEVDRQF
jgi:pimeloyl-ACP methyl ester carboxylesterase